MKNKINKLMEKITAKKIAKVKKDQKPKYGMSLFFSKLMGYLTASTPVLKKVRKKEMMKALKSLFAKTDKGKKPEPEKPAAAQKPAETAAAGKNKSEAETAPEKQESKPANKWDFTGLFVEIDSFISWLLCFYIIYFFLVNFSFEKNIGLGREFVLKTLKSELILDITIFLLMAHFALRIRNTHFRKNFAATLFLICFSLGAYALLIVNF